MKPLRRIIVKVGSNVLARPDGTPDVTRMSALVDQVAALHQAGYEIILVSSGAVASGRSEVHPTRKLDSVDQRQLFSAVGQVKLIYRYYELFREHGITVAQVLTMKESFATRRHYLNQKRCMTVMLENGVIPIVNENDTVSVTELMFTDNDELSGLIASMMDAQALVPGEIRAFPALIAPSHRLHRPRSRPPSAAANTPQQSRPFVQTPRRSGAPRHPAPPSVAPTTAPPPSASGPMPPPDVRPSAGLPALLADRPRFPMGQGKTGFHALFEQLPSVPAHSSKASGPLPKSQLSHCPLVSACLGIAAPAGQTACTHPVYSNSNPPSGGRGLGPFFQPVPFFYR